MEPVQEKLAEDSLLEEIVEQQLSDGSAELESTTEWPVSTVGDEVSMGDHIVLLIDLHEEL
jgi:hypothetical protein